MPRTVQVKTKVALSPTKKFSYLRISNIWIGKFLFFTVHLVYPSINLSLVLQSVVPHFHFSQFEFGVTESSLAPYHSRLMPWPRCPRQIRVAAHAWLVFHLNLTSFTLNLTIQKKIANIVKFKLFLKNFG